MKRKPKPLGTIRQEKAACIKAFRKYPKATRAWCCHHDKLVEQVGYDFYMVRLRYIIAHKNVAERAIRFRNFRPVRLLKKLESELAKAGVALCKAARNLTARDLNRDWPDNTWNAKKESIFPQ